MLHVPVFVLHVPVFVVPVPVFVMLYLLTGLGSFGLGFSMALFTQDFIEWVKPLFSKKRVCTPAERQLAKARFEEYTRTGRILPPKSSK